MLVKVKKIYENSILPKYATDGSGCFDIHARIQVGFDSVWIGAGECHVFDTGLQFEIPEGYVMMIYSRSGHGFKNDVRLANCVGIIDSDYRGELKIKLTRDSYDDVGELVVCEGDRIAQGMVIPVDKVFFEEVSELSSTERGTSGFGSTGNN